MSYTCPCCGWGNLDQKPYKRWPDRLPVDAMPPYEDSFGAASYEVCRCCGFEFGNDDNPGTADLRRFAERAHETGASELSRRCLEVVTETFERGTDYLRNTVAEQTMLATPEMDGAFETIAQLVEAFDGKVWLVSKCGPRVRARTERWLAAHNFHARTGVDRTDMRVCRRRPEKRYSGRRRDRPLPIDALVANDIQRLS